MPSEFRLWFYKVNMIELCLFLANQRDFSLVKKEKRADKLASLYIILRIGNVS